MTIKDNLKKFSERVIFGKKGTSESYIKWLKKLGMDIGENVVLYSPWTILIDRTRPWMIHIGNNVHITANCTVLQHDGSRRVIQHLTGAIYGSSDSIYIGNNVFIGQRSIIMKGARIGDNVIIGAGSVVSGKLESNAVYGGIPARKIMSIEDYIEKRKKRQLQEAIDIVHQYEAHFDERPPKSQLAEFFLLFTPPTASLSKEIQSLIQANNDGRISHEFFDRAKPMFSSYDEFLTYAEQH